jgi:hypothetical protein
MGAPALIDAQSAQILTLLNSLRAWAYRRIEGGLASNNGSAIAASVATLTLDYAPGIVFADGTVSAFASATADSATATFTFSAPSGKDAVAACIIDASGAPDFVAVWGSEADTGEAVGPTDAEITAAVGHDDWAKFAEVTVTITGASAGTFEVNNNERSGGDLAVFASDLATSEADFSVGGETIPVNRS